MEPVLTMVSVASDIPPTQGEIVRVRSRRYLVEGVEAAARPDDQTLVRLSCLEDDAEGEELEVLWEKEVDAQRMSDTDWSRLAGGAFDEPHLFGAYYHTLRWNSVTSTDPTLFQAPYRAGTFDDTDKKGVANPISAMHELIQRDSRNADRIFPFISGEDVLENPTHSGHRFVINFEQMSEAEARHWPELMTIVEAKVKPERLLQNREVRAKYWWRYGEAAPALYEAIHELPRAMVNPLYAQHLCFVFLPTRSVFANKLNVFSIDSIRFFAALQSRCHEA